MGTWFVKYFSSKGIPTILSDVKVEAARLVASTTGAEVARSNTEAVIDVDVALISVPIDKTRDAILETAPHMRRGSILVEVSSIKGHTIEALREFAFSGIRTLSVHPLFGASSESLKGRTIAVIPVVNGDIETDLARQLFEEAEIVVAEQEEHDRIMAIVLSLTYFMNLAFAKILSEEGLLALKRLSGTTFTVQLAITESVMCENSNLVMSLLKENRFAKSYIDRFISEASAIRELLGKGNESFDKLYNNLKASLNRDPDYLRADERRYKAFSALGP